MKVYLQTSQLPITEKFEAINFDVPKNLICNFFMAYNKNKNSKLSDFCFIVVMHESYNAELRNSTKFRFIANI